MQSLTHRAPITNIGTVTATAMNDGTEITQVRGFQFWVPKDKTAADYDGDAFGWDLDDLRWCSRLLALIQTL